MVGAAAVTPRLGGHHAAGDRAGCYGQGRARGTPSLRERSPAAWAGTRRAERPVLDHAPDVAYLIAACECGDSLPWNLDRVPAISRRRGRPEPEQQA